MKQLTAEQAAQPLQRGHIRITIRYKETDYLMTFDGIFNPDRNLNPIKMILRKRAPKAKEIVRLGIGVLEKVPGTEYISSAIEIEDSVAGSANAT